MTSSNDVAPQRLTQNAPAVQVVDLGKMDAESMVPGMTRRYAVGQNTTVTLFEYKAGGIAPLHNHVQEQITYVIRGHLRATIGGETFDLYEGQAALIPSGVPHSFTAMTDALEIDFFTPSRQDWLRGENSYFVKAIERNPAKE